MNGAATDVCAGDSGGPLLHIGVEATIIGVVSYGPVSSIPLGDKTWDQTICGDPNRPGVYTRISAYRAWIDTTIAADEAASAASNFLSPIIDFFANLGKVKDAGPEAGNTAGGMNEQGVDRQRLGMVAVAAKSGGSADDDYAKRDRGGRRPPGRSGAAAAKCGQHALLGWPKGRSIAPRKADRVGA